MAAMGVQAVMWIVGKEDGPKHIVMLIRPPRKRLYSLVCFCRRRRKDGTCQLTDGIRPLIYASQRVKVRLEHPQIDRARHSLPEPDPKAFDLIPEVRAKVLAE